MAVFLLFVVLALVAVWTPWHACAFAAFRSGGEGSARRAFFRKWVMTSLLLFGGGTLGALALLGRLRQLWDLPPEFDSLAAPARAMGATVLVAAATVAVAACAVVVVAVACRERGRLLPAVFGDVEALLPRDGAEGAWAAVLSLNAGLTEEATFRLLLPLLITLAVGDAPLGMAASALVFGLAHLYLGWRGVAATMMAGVFLSLVYLAAGNLLVPVAVHVATDWVGLLALPRLVGWRRLGQP